MIVKYVLIFCKSFSKFLRNDKTYTFEDILKCGRVNIFCKLFSKLISKLVQKHSLLEVVFLETPYVFSASVRPACHVLMKQCVSSPCQHGSPCSEGWNRPLCDCSMTNYGGPTCGRGKYILNSKTAT